MNASTNLENEQIATAAAAAPGTKTPRATKPQNASLALVQNTLKQYDRVEAGLADLETKYKDVVFAVTTTKGMEEAKAARRAIREPRYAVDKAADAAKAPLNALKKEIDNRKTAITNRLVELETPIHAQIKAEEDRLEAIKEAEKKAKAETAARIQAAIDGIRGLAVTAATSVAPRIADMRKVLEDMEISVETYGDRAGEAMQTKLQVLETLDSLHASAVAREEADAKAAAARAELDRLRQEQAERERLANEQRQAEEREAAEKLAEENRQAQAKLDKERAEFQRLQQEAQAAQQAAEKKLQAEREALEADRQKYRQEQEALATPQPVQATAPAEEIQDSSTTVITADSESQTPAQLELDTGSTDHSHQQVEAAACNQVEAAPDPHALLIRRSPAELMLQALQAVAADAGLTALAPAVQAMVRIAILETTGEAACSNS